MPVATQAVILAGGQGTRLRPLTLSRAKPVVPLLNRPFLAYQLALLRQHGVTDIVLSCSYRVDDVRQALGDARAFGVTLRYVVEDEPLGTGGGVRNAADLARGTVFVLNGDQLTDADLTAMRALHEARGSRLTIFLMPVDDPRAYGLVETAADGRVLRFREKPGPEEPIPSNMINAGIYLIDASLLARMPAGRVISIEREFFPAVIADDIPTFGWSASAYWCDIGNPAVYRQAQIDLLEGRVKTPLTPAGELRDGSWLAPGVAADSARLEAPSVVGADVTIGSGAHVGPHAVIGPGSVIGAAARVQRAVLWERVRVGEGAVVCDSAVGADAVIGEGATVTHGVALGSGAVVPPAAVRRGEHAMSA